MAYYARIIKETAIARALVSAAQRIIEKAHSSNGNETDALIAFAQSEILAISSYEANKQRALDIRDVVKHVFHDIEERFQQGGTLPGHSTGFASLDSMIGGLKQNLFYILGGRPGDGKTAIALNIARTVSVSGEHIAFFSLEMPRNELVLRLLSGEADVDGHRLARGFIGDTELQRIVSAADIIAKLPLTIDDTGGLPIDRLMARARRIKTERGLGAIFIDYLQLVRPSQKWNSREQEVSEVSRSLKALAKELSVPVIALSQLNRGSVDRPRKTPSLADLRESGALEQDADVITFLSSADDDGTLDLTIAKNRQGPTGQIQMIFDKSRTKFKEK